MKNNDIKENNKGDEIMEIKVNIDNKEYILTLEDNKTADAFINLLPREFNMQELNGNEKYVYMDNILPENAAIPEQIQKGDVMLYGNNCLVIFYKSFYTNYSYTKIGHINNLPDLNDENVKVLFLK